MQPQFLLKWIDDTHFHWVATDVYKYIRMSMSVLGKTTLKCTLIYTRLFVCKQQETRTRILPCIKVEIDKNVCIIGKKVPNSKWTGFDHARQRKANNSDFFAKARPQHSSVCIYVLFLFFLSVSSSLLVTSMLTQIFTDFCHFHCINLCGFFYALKNILVFLYKIYSKLFVLFDLRLIRFSIQFSGT